MGDTQQVGIISDSVADIPPHIADELGITVVPLSVTIDDETFLDGSITMEEFFRRMIASKSLPTTSQPPVGTYVDAFHEALDHYAHIVYVSISSALSGTFESAMEAARQVGDRVHVFDSLSLSWAEGYQAVRAVRAARTGATLAEVRRVLEDVRERMQLIVGLDTLEYLHRGGRIGRVSALLGSMLNLKVTLTVDRDGSLAPGGRHRGTRAALQAGVDWLTTHVDETTRAAFGVLHSQSPDKAAWLEEEIRSRFNVGELDVIETGPVLASHAGTGWGLTVCPLD